MFLNTFYKFVSMLVKHAESAHSQQLLGNDTFYTDGSRSGLTARLT